MRVFRPSRAGSGFDAPESTTPPRAGQPRQRSAGAPLSACLRAKGSRGEIPRELLEVEVEVVRREGGGVRQQTAVGRGSSRKTSSTAPARRPARRAAASASSSRRFPRPKLQRKAVGFSSARRRASRRRSVSGPEGRKQRTWSASGRSASSSSAVATRSSGPNQSGAGCTPRETPRTRGPNGLRKRPAARPMRPKPRIRTVAPARRRARAANAGRGHGSPASAAKGRTPWERARTQAAAVSPMIAPWNEP